MNRNVALVFALVALLLAACTNAQAAKTVLDLKEVGASSPVSNDTRVPAGIYIGIGEKYACQIVAHEEGEEIEEESMILELNKSATDKASGDVAAPPCFEVAEEGGASSAQARRHRAVRHRRALSLLADPVSATGTLTGQEMKTSKKGAMIFSKALEVTFETGGLKCAYLGKPKIAATWPPAENPEFPNIGKTADLTAELAFKLNKARSEKKGCAKTEEAYVETWLGPLGEELEAQLVS